MTERRSVENRISLWLEEQAAGRLPDRVLDATFEQTRREGQPAGPSDRRSFPMSRLIPASVALGAVAIIVALVASAFQSRSPAELQGAYPQKPASVAPNVDGTLDATVDLVFDLEEWHVDQSVIVPSTRDFEVVTWSGTIDVVTADRNLAGDVRLDSSHELTRTPTGPTANHAWGSLTGHLGDASCDGSIAFTYYRAGPAGGTFFLRCSDGSMLGGQIPSVVVRHVDPGWQLTARVDAAYHTGDERPR